MYENINVTLYNGDVLRVDNMSIVYVNVMQRFLVLYIFAYIFWSVQSRNIFDLIHEGDNK